MATKNMHVSMEDIAFFNDKLPRFIEPSLIYGDNVNGNNPLLKIIGTTPGANDAFIFVDSDSSSTLPWGLFYSHGHKPLTPPEGGTAAPFMNHAVGLIQNNVIQSFLGSFVWSRNGFKMGFPERDVILGHNAANGRMIFGNGLCIQWGSVSVSANTITTVTFPLAFTTLYQALGTPSVTTDVSVESLTAASINVRAIASCTLRWFAIGHTA